MKKLLFTFVLLFSQSSWSQVFKVGYLFDSQMAQWQKDQVLVVKDGVIIEKNPSAIDKSLAVIDLSKKWVMPALIDSHSHLFLNDETFSYDFPVGLKKWVNKSKKEKILLARKRAKAMKEVGFTLSRDLGNNGEVSLEEMDAIEGIKIVSSGAGYAPLFGQLPVPSPKEQAIEYQQISKGYDAHPYPLVKIYADEEPNHNFAKLSDLKALTEKAHQQGKLVAVHAILKEGIDLALKSGADTLEHGTFMTPAQLTELSHTTMIYVPTNSQALFLNPKRKSYFHEDSLKDFNHICANIKKAKSLGIPLAFGSDHYFSFPGEHFGENLIEILQSFRQCGLSNNEILKTATFTAAHTQNKWKVGKLDIGYLADFNVYEKSPAQDLKNLLKIKALYREGVWQKAN